ncbi:glycosyltransferase, partial [Lacrimispora sp. 38-1]|uniref:glycosyltransferase n=1 Tax=Lacrimispora sp. 38-1 TaxID=3125778 RepID=UPI003CF1E71F
LKGILYDAPNLDLIDEYKIRLSQLNISESFNISFVLICKNEERCIARCLENIKKEKDSNDEIVVIDSGSTDRTVEIIRENYSFVKLINTEWKDDFSALRNYGIGLSKYDWIFFVDADEIIVEGSVSNLKKYLSIIEWYRFDKIICSPTINNNNNQIVQGVRRILKKTSGIKFFGCIHEEPRDLSNLLTSEVSNISFNNIILMHDGYDKDVMEKKNKIQRNITLLKKMLNIEPQHPRWKYFYCRDGKSIISINEYEQYLLEVVNLAANNQHYHFYEIRAISNLIEYYCEMGDIEKAHNMLGQLKMICPDLSDVLYFDALVSIGSMKNATYLLLDRLCKFSSEHTEIEYGSINSYLYHIDYITAIVFFETGEYKKCFSILKKLEAVGFGNYSKTYFELYESLRLYYEK